MRWIVYHDSSDRGTESGRPAFDANSSEFDRFIRFLRYLRDDGPPDFVPLLAYQPITGQWMEEPDAVGVEVAAMEGEYGRPKLRARWVKFMNDYYDGDAIGACLRHEAWWNRSLTVGAVLLVPGVAMVFSTPYRSQAEAERLAAELAAEPGRMTDLLRRSEPGVVPDVFGCEVREVRGKRGGQ